jgi:hypothetical protein
MESNERIWHKTILHRKQITSLHGQKSQLGTLYNNMIHSKYSLARIIKFWKELYCMRLRNLDFSYLNLKEKENKTCSRVRIQGKALGSGFRVRN